MYSSRITREFLNFYVHFDIINKSISFVLRPSTDLVRVLLGCQKWGRKKKRHRTSTQSKPSFPRSYFSSVSGHSQGVQFTSCIYFKSLKSPAQLRESHVMIPCVSLLCPPTVIQVQHQCPSDLPEVDTDGSLSQRETLLLGDPYKMSHLYELQKYQGTMSSKPFAKDMG